MNTYFVCAAVLACLVALAHTVLGERLVFRRLRKSGVVPAYGGDLLHESHVRIVWASWHALSVCGVGFAAILVWLARQPPDAPFVSRAIAASMFASALLVLVGTKARHPGWVGLLGVAVLAWLGGP